METAASRPETAAYGGPPSRTGGIATLSETVAARYSAAQRLAGGRCPIEAGLICRLADHECQHGRLAFDRTAPCGCWPEEGAVVCPLPQAGVRSKRPRSQRVAA